MGIINNLSKTFRYVNNDGNEIEFTFDNGYLINKPRGIDTLQVSLSTAQGINQIGASVQSQIVQTRPIVISGILTGANQDSKKYNLMSVVRPEIGGRLYADDYFIDVFVTSSPTISASKQFAGFQFSLLAPYPFWQRAKTTQVIVGGVDYLFRLPCAFYSTYKFGELSTDVYKNCMNNGQTSIPFSVSFYALETVTNPKILNIETNEYLELSKSMVADERIDVDITHDTMTAISNVDGDITGAVVLSSSLFSLDVGDNYIKPMATAGISNLITTISYATELVGVTV